MVDLKKKTAFEESLDDILNSAKWFNLLNQMIGIIPFTSKEEIMKPGNLKLQWPRYAVLVILSVAFTSYTAVKLIKDSGFTEISMLIALAVCALALIQSITLLNIFGALVTKYYRLLAEVDVLYMISNNNYDEIPLNSKYYKVLSRADTYLLVYIYASVPLRQALIMEILNLDYLQNLSLFVTAHANCYVKFTFISLSLRILQRLSKLNSSIMLLKKFSWGNKIPLRDVAIIKDVTDRLYHLCRMHYKLCHLMRELNKTFAFQLLCSLAVSMGDVLFQSYYLYHLLFNDVPDVTTTMILCPIVWLVDEMVEIFLLVRSCASTCESANTTPILLHEFRNELDNIEIESHIQMYSLQMLHQKIRVSALGFFDIDYSLIYSIVGAVTTYLVIFIQFDQQNTDIRLYPSVGNSSGP